MEYFSLPKMDKLHGMTHRNALRECFVNIPKKTTGFPCYRCKGIQRKVVSQFFCCFLLHSKGRMCTINNDWTHF